MTFLRCAWGSPPVSGTAQGGQPAYEMTSPARKIPEGIHEELFALTLELNPRTGLAWSDKELVHWLAERGVKCSHDTVTATLRPYRRAAREARLERIRARAAEDLPLHLGTHATLMDQLERDAKAGKTVAARVRATGEFRKGIEMLVRAASGSEDVKVSGTPGGLAEFLAGAFGSSSS